MQINIPGFPQNLFEAKCWYCQSLCMRKNRTNKIVDSNFLSIHVYFKRLFNMIQILQICNLNKYPIRSCDLFIKCGVLSAGFHNISHGYGKSKVQWSPVKCKIEHRHMFLPWLAMMCKRLMILWSCMIPKTNDLLCKSFTFCSIQFLLVPNQVVQFKNNMIANSNILNVGPHKITTNVNGWNENSYVLHKVGIRTMC